MKYMQPPLVAFFLLIFTGPVGAMALSVPLGPLLVTHLPHLGDPWVGGGGRGEVCS